MMVIGVLWKWMRLLRKREGDGKKSLELGNTEKVVRERKENEGAAVF